MKKAIDIQQEYYSRTASDYDNMHMSALGEGDHDMALMFLSAFIKKNGIQSLLDIGAGTGRTINYLMANHPGLRIIGLEPVRQLREQAYTKGISEDVLIDGDGTKINFKNDEFDIVCEFGVLHHIPEPGKMVEEMLRVAKTGIFISDSNNFGQGGYISRKLKQTLNFLGVWKGFEFIRTKGRMYHISDGDGLFYSYSVFNNYKQIKKVCPVIHLLNTTDTGIDFYKEVSHVGLLGLKHKKVSL